MGLQKGQTNNPAGRPAGVPNKASGELRQLINDFLEKNFSQVQKDMLKLQPKDRVRLYIDLLSFGLPKLQSASLEIDYSQMTEEQLDHIIESLKQSANEIT